MFGKLASALLLFFSSAVLCQAYAAPEERVDPLPEPRYENAARTVYAKFSPDYWTSTPVKPRLPLENQKNVLLETVSSPMRDCSDEKYRCTFGARRVFAVPRDRLSPHAVYVAGGSTLRVEECLRGNEAICQVALISSDCQQYSGLEGCAQVPGGRTKSAYPGPVLYFIYNEDFGVTAYGYLNSPGRTAAARLAAAGQMFLQGERGLLRER